MTPEVRLLLVEQELERFMVDDREQPDRDRVHVDRLTRILHLDRFGVSAR